MEPNADRLFDQLIEATCAEDREWFAAHPLDDVRHRPYVTGEFWPLFPECSMVEVRKIAAGVRCRTPYLVRTDEDGA